MCFANECSTGMGGAVKIAVSREIYTSIIK